MAKREIKAERPAERKVKVRKPRWSAEFEARLARASEELERTGEPAQLYPELPMLLDD